MSFFIAARKTGTVFLESGLRSPDLAGQTLADFRAALCVNYAVTDADLSLLVLADNHASTLRAMAGDGYTLAWSGGEVTAMDFSAEDAKLILKVSASKATIMADNADASTVTVELWKADGSGVAVGVNTTADMPILTPEGGRKVRVSLVAGTASRLFKTAKPGIWLFPAVKRFGVVRVGQSATVEALASFDTM